MQKNITSKYLAKNINLDNSIFKAYDIRGIVNKNLDENIAFYIGKAIAQQVKASGQHSINIGYDGRLSSPSLYKALSEGIISNNINVINLGMVTTPMTYFANYYIDDELQNLGITANSSVIITGSHNPASYNGFKVVINSNTLYGEQIQQLYKICLQQIQLEQLENIDNNINNIVNTAKVYPLDILPAYTQAIIKNIKVKHKLKVALDAGNGVAGAYAPQILQKLNCEIIPLFCEVDGTFPNHHPDPAHIENLHDLIKIVQKENCDFGIAFDGDGDRLGVVTKYGEIIFPDRQMILYAGEVIKNNPQAKIVFDVKCSNNLAKFIKTQNAVPLMYKTGHSLIKAYMKEQNAKLGGEMSGHIFFADRWYGFDDATYTAARLIEILSQYTIGTSSDILSALPNSYSTPEINIDCTNLNIQPVEIINNFKEYIEKYKNTLFIDTIINYIDGVRIDFNDGFGLIRASNTTPCLVLRFEGDSENSLDKIQTLFKQSLVCIAPFLLL